MRLWCVPAVAWLLCDLLIVLAVRDVGPKRGVMIAAAAMLVALVVVWLFRRRAAMAITLAALGFAAFTAWATANAPEHQVKQVYRAWLEAHANLDGQAVCALEDPGYRALDCDVPTSEWAGARQWLGYAVVVTEVRGDEATAALRSGGCTVASLAAEFRRSGDGRWLYSRGAMYEGNEPVCVELDSAP